MGKLLSDAQIRAYRRDGYLCPLTALSPAEAVHYRAKLEAAEAAAGGSLPGPYRHKPHLVYTWAQELIRHPKILDAVEDVIGPDILAWESVFSPKSRTPRTTSAGTRTSPRSGGRRGDRLGRAEPEHARERLHARGARHPPA